MAAKNGLRALAGNTGHGMGSQHHGHHGHHNQKGKMKTADIINALKRTERELSHWHNWALSERADYKDSEGAKQTAEVLEQARDMIQQCRIFGE